MSEDQTRPFTYEAAYSSEIDFERSKASSTAYRRYPVYALQEWSLEALSSVLALGALAGIAAIFGYMDNKPYSAWTPPVSLNATVSILTTACTALLMFSVSEFIGQLKWLHFKGNRHKLSHFEKYDLASRGVPGSIKFLTTMRPSIASIGAFITILRISFPSFTQQVVQLEQRNIITPDDNVTFGFAHEYSPDVLGQLANAGIAGIPQDPSMQSAIVQGLYGIETPATFNCPSACQWTGSYMSLGFKSSCNNVTQATLQTQACNGTQSNNVCNMTTPGGLTVTTRYVNTDSATNYFMNATSLITAIQKARLASLPDITRFALYRSSPDANFTPLNINVTECVLSLTAYEYTDAKANGSDFAFGTVREVDFGSNRDIWKDGGHAPPLGLVYTNATKDADTNTDIPALNISHAGLFAIENFFQSDAIVSEWVAGNFQNNKFGLAAALSGDVDIDARFKKMAASMTDYVRRGPNARAAGGERVESVPFVSIRWEYFIAPIVTEALGIVLAVLTIFSNRKSRDVPLWKSSALAVLACRVDKGDGELQSEVKDIKKIEEDAENTEVRLQ